MEVDWWLVSVVLALYTRKFSQRETLYTDYSLHTVTAEKLLTGPAARLLAPYGTRFFSRRPSVNELNASLSSLSNSLRMQLPPSRRDFLDESLTAVHAAAQVAPETAPDTHALLTPRFAASLVWITRPSSPLPP